MKQPFKTPYNIVPFTVMLGEIGFPLTYDDGNDYEDELMHYSNTAKLETIGQSFVMLDDDDRKAFKELLSKGLNYLTIHNK